MVFEYEKNILKNVSRETIENLKRYRSILNEWQEKMNLVSKNSLSDAWNRHFLDSAQLSEYIDEKAKLIYDFGSGAGFPALVLAIIFKEKNPNTEFVLVESIRKKSLFLNEIIEKFNLNAKVINDRIENIKLPCADYITARALSSLDNLFEYVKPFCNENTNCLFLKGKTYQEEIENAGKKWSFFIKVEQNKLSKEGVILQIRNIRRKK